MYKIQSRWERKGNQHCASGNTVVSITLPFPSFLHLKKHVAGQKFHEEEEVGKKNPSHCADARAGGGVL